MFRGRCPRDPLAGRRRARTRPAQGCRSEARAHPVGPTSEVGRREVHRARSPSCAGPCPGRQVGLGRKYSRACPGAPTSAARCLQGIGVPPAHPGNRRRAKVAACGHRPVALCRVCSRRPEGTVEPQPAVASRPERIGPPDQAACPSRSTGFGRIVDAVHEAIVVFEPTSLAVLDANQGALTLFGSTMAETVGRPVTDWMVGMDRERLLGLVEPLTDGTVDARDRRPRLPPLRRRAPCPWRSSSRWPSSKTAPPAWSRSRATSASGSRRRRACSAWPRPSTPGRPSSTP